MSSPPDLPAELVWATRGRAWGFRFLADGGRSDPLAAYESAFAEVVDEGAAYHRDGDSAALRLIDPLGRADAAGRVIPHDFVLSGALATGVTSVEDGVRLVWPLVAEAYARVWDAPTAPTRRSLLGG